MPRSGPDLGRRLLDARCYPHPVDGPRLVETHISWVLLTGRYAYKIKKPVRLPFLDFSDAGARHRFCDEELRVNRRLAPALYLDVVPITGTPDEPRVGGDGEPFEHAVRMVQFDDADRLDRVLARGELDAERLRETGAMLARFHAAAAAAGPGGPFATAERITRESIENLAALGAPGAAPPDALAALREWIERGLDRLGTTFATRLGAGRVRECHGDLHLENLALVDGRVLAFDAIEFDPGLRWIDVMSEIAFTMMDLLHRGRADLAHALLDAYLEEGGDHAGLPVLRHYLVYRALVRAKIAAIRAGEAPGDSAEAVEAASAREAYVSLAGRLARPPHRPLLVATHGVSGSGKSRLAAALLGPLGAVRVRSDVERARLFEPGPARYAAGSTADVYAYLARAAGQALDGGWTVIVDATCLESRWRRLLRRTASAHGADFVLLDCQADPALLRARVAARAERGLDASEATPEILERQLRAGAALGAPELRHAVQIDTASDVDADALAHALRTGAG